MTDFDAILSRGGPWVRAEVIGDCLLLQGDCQQVMPHLGRVGAVVTDPPYGINRDRGMGGGGYDSTGRYKRKPRQFSGDWDAEAPSPEAIRHAVSLGGNAIVWGGQFFAPYLPVSGKWLWWDKIQNMPSYGDGEMAWTNLPGTAARKFVQSLSSFVAGGEAGTHPTQKPVALMRWCLGFLPDARLILDPFMSSGTTGVACVKEGRRFIGIELDPGYFDTACRRVAQAVAQPNLFLAPSPPPATQETLL